MNSKKMYVFAGPNGSGKSSVVDQFMELPSFPKLFICPDNLVVGDKNNVSSYLKAMADAESIRFSYISQGVPFAFETVLSNEDKLNFIRFAQSSGYYVHMIYISTNDPQINIERVKLRVENGGHDVPTDKVISRYYKSMELMYNVMCIADATDVFDNSGYTPEFIACVRDGDFLVRGSIPDWVQTFIINKANQDNKNVVLYP